MRISTQTIVQQSTRRLEQRLAEFADVQEDLSTGKRFQVASEDVAGMNVSLTLRAELRSLEQADRNADDGKARLDAADSQLQQLNRSLLRARELAVRGATNLGQDERDAIAEEIAQLRDQMVGNANATYLDQSLFGGFVPGDAVQLVAGTWTYTGDAGAVTRRVSESETVQVNVTGDDIFGFTAGQDVFSTLDQLEADLRAGDQPAVAARIGDLDASHNRLLSGLAEIGAATNRVESAMQRNAEKEGILRNRRSEVEDVDLANAVMELQTQEVALQATLGALGRALQPSLVDFLG